MASKAYGGDEYNTRGGGTEYMNDSFGNMSNRDFRYFKRKNKSLYDDMQYNPAYIDAYNQQ